MNPLKSISGTIIGGFVLAAIILYFMPGEHVVGVPLKSLVIWLHVLSGVTWIGLLYYFNFVHHAFTLGLMGDSPNPYATTIGIGAWLGTIMLFNVWGLIWPNQKKILGMVEATAEEVAKAKNIALLASRSNTLMSIPMLMSMIGPGHGWMM